MKNKLVCSVIVTVIAIGGPAGCATARKTESLSHEIWTYSDAGNVTRREVWTERHEGGATAVMANPAATQMASYHTNQAGLGGASSFTVGNAGSSVAPMTASYNPAAAALTTGNGQSAGGTNAAGAAK
jgi:hypothetical protein